MSSVLVEVKDIPQGNSVECWITSKDSVPIYLMTDRTKLVKFNTAEEANAFLLGVSVLIELLNNGQDYEIIKKREVF